MSTFTLPAQVLTVDENTKKENDTPESTTPDTKSTEIILTGNLSGTLAEILNKQLQEPDSVVNQSEDNVSLSTECLTTNRTNKVFIYANTVLGLEEESPVITADLYTMFKKYKKENYKCFLVLDSTGVTKSVRNAPTLEGETDKLNIKSEITVKRGINNILKYVKGC